jgi:predicted flap endonuclease-1-like 5' DNA nuclease
MTKNYDSCQSISMMEKDWELEQLPELSVEDCLKLDDNSIKTTLDLLNYGCNLTQRQTLAARLQVPVTQINKWVILADLSRIPSIGLTYCEFLLQIGICSSSQLAQMRLDDLEKLVKIFQIRIFQRRELCPTVSRMSEWISQAQYLNKIGNNKNDDIAQ